MTEFPFPANTIRNHRFHGVIEGSFEIVGSHIQLKTTFGSIRLLPRSGKNGANAFYAARKTAENHPGEIVRAYGYPRTTDAAVVDRMELCSWHLLGTPDPDGPLSVARRFQSGELFLCGRVRRLEGGLVTVKVKSVVNGRDLRWWVTGLLAGHPPLMNSKTLFGCGITADGLLMVRPLKTISPPVKPNRRTAPASTPKPIRKPRVDRQGRT